MAPHAGPSERAQAIGDLTVIRLAFDMARFAVAMVAILMWLVVCVVGVLLMLIVWPLFVLALLL